MAELFVEESHNNFQMERSLLNSNEYCRSVTVNAKKGLIEPVNHQLADLG